MDILYDFHPFVFGGSLQKGFYSAALPLKTPPSSLVSTHGRLFGIFTLRYPEFFPLETISKEILPYFEQLYYERPCDSPHSHLIRSAADAQAYLEKRILEVNGVDSVDFSFVFGCVWGSVLYVVRCGGVSALRLYRDSTFGVMYEINPSSGSTSLSSMSGYIKPHDLLVLYDSSVDITAFPLSATALYQLGKPMVYSKLTQMFDLSSQKNNVGSVSGFYVAADDVPSAEEEGILLADVQVEKDLYQVPINGDDPVLHSETVMNEEIEQPDSAQGVKPEVNVVAQSSVAQNLLYKASFQSRFMSRFRFSHHTAYVRIKNFLSFFSRGRVFVLGCMFLVLFAGFILAGKDYEKTFKVEKELSALKLELLPKIDEAYKQGQYYAELNPDRAKRYLQDAQGYIAQFDSEGRNDPEIAKKIRAIADAYAIVTKTYLLDGLSPFFDLTAINQDAHGSKIALIPSYLVVSDTQQNAVYKISMENKSAASVIGQEDVSGLISAEGDLQAVYAVSSKGIVRSVENDARVISLREAGSEWGTIIDMQVYSNSVYLLDSSRNQIWKYIPEGNSVGLVRNYVSSDSEIVFEKATSMAIDGNVWVGLSNGEVVKLFSGKKDVFNLGALDTPLLSLKSIYTDDLTDYLYLLDDTMGRVVVFSKKDGLYVSTYLSDSFKGGQDLAVDFESGHLYVLRDTFIYRIEIREKSIESKS